MNSSFALRETKDTFEILNNDERENFDDDDELEDEYVIFGNKIQTLDIIGPIYLGEKFQMQALKETINVKEIILPYKNVSIYIDYPISNPTKFNISTNSDGFTEYEILKAIFDIYNKIYQDEENTSDIKTIEQGDRNLLLNRNTTNGTYGIWGHDLDDLSLMDIDAYQSEKGEITLTLNIES